MSETELNTKKANELVDVQTSHIIKYIFTNIIVLGKVETNKTKKFDKLVKHLNSLLPFKPIGTMLIEDPIDGKVWLSLKPCMHDHSFDLQLNSVQSIMESETKKKKLMDTIGMLIFVVRHEYKRFVLENESFITSLLHVLPDNRKDISLKIDTANTTLYVYEDYPLRSGVYLERDSFVASKPDDTEPSMNDVVIDTISQIEDMIKNQQMELNCK